MAHVGRYRRDSHKGVDVALATIVRMQAKVGICVEVWQFSSRVESVQRTDHTWGPVFEIPCHSWRVRSVLQLPSVSRRFLKTRGEMIDVAHLHSVFIPENLQVSKLGIPFVISPHGGYRTNVLRGRNRIPKVLWMALFERACLRRASGILVNSRTEAAELNGLASPNKILVVPNGVADDVLDSEVIPAAAGSIWLFLGRLDVETKGLDLLLRAYARLLRSKSCLVPNLVIAGPDHRGGREWLIKATRELGLSEKVQIPGSVAGRAKRDLIESCRLFILLSRNEGMPLALLEAMALGRPVAVTPGTSLGDLVLEYEAGWVTQPAEDSVERILFTAAEAHADRLNELGCNARQLARSRFRWSEIIPEFTSVYERAARARPRGSQKEHPY